MIDFTLFFEFFKIGLFCFGGAFGMIPVIKDTVLDRLWMTESQFYGFLGICESTPGPIAVNLATYIGYSQGGFFGSVTAVLGVTLPSFIVILLIAAVLKSFASNKYISAAMSGIRPVVAALIIWAGLSFIISALGIVSTQGLEIKKTVIFLTVVLLYFVSAFVFRKKPSSVFLIIVSAFAGLGICMIFDTANI